MHTFHHFLRPIGRTMLNVIVKSGECFSHHSSQYCYRAVQLYTLATVIVLS